jgi:hypothetical protein
MLKGVYHIVIWLVKHFLNFFTPSLPPGEERFLGGINVREKSLDFNV